MLCATILTEVDQLLAATMPITFTVSPVTPGVVSPSGLGNNPMALLSQSCNPPPKDMGAVLQCSITPAEGRRISPQSNGFVQAVFQAYAAHYHLVIRCVFYVFFA